MFHLLYQACLLSGERDSIPPPPPPPAGEPEARALTVRLKRRGVPFAWGRGQVQQCQGSRNEDSLGQKWSKEVSGWGVGTGQSLGADVGCIEMSRGGLGGGLEGTRGRPLSRHTPALGSLELSAGCVLCPEVTAVGLALSCL